MIDIQGYRLPEKHHEAAQKLSNVRWMKCVEPYNEGLSEASVFLVQVEYTGGNRSGLAVLKVDTQEEIEREIAYCKDAHDILGSTIPKVVDQGEPYHAGNRIYYKAALMELANSSVGSEPLYKKLSADPRELGKSLERVAQLLSSWNPPAKLHGLRESHDTPSAFLRRLFMVGEPTDTSEYRIKNLVERLHRAGVKVQEHLLKNSMHVSFEPAGQPLPNPIWYAQQGLMDFPLGKLQVHSIPGYVHGDLHCANILFDPGKPKALPNIIDFAKGDKDKPFLFDWLYLEFDILFRAAKIEKDEDWTNWMKLARVVTHCGKNRGVKPWDRFNKFELGNLDHDRILYGIHRLRRYLRAYWDSLDSTMHDWLDAAYWLCGYYAGLNFARKRVKPKQTGERAVTRDIALQRYAALYYAGCCLERLFEVKGIPPPRSSGTTPFIGPHPWVFIDEGDAPNFNKSVYISATPTYRPITQQIINFSPYEKKCVLPHTEAPEARWLIRQMGNTGHFIAVIADQDEPRNIFFGRTHMHQSELECEAAVAQYVYPEDRLILLKKGINVIDSHPATRDRDTIAPDFQIEDFDDEKCLKKLIDKAMLRWQLSTNKPSLALDTLYPRLRWQGLMEHLYTPSAGSIQVIRLVGLENPAIQTLLWDWLMAQIRVQAIPQLSYPPAMLHTEEHLLASSFIANLSYALMKSKSRTLNDYPDDTTLLNFALQDITKALSKVDVYFLIPKFNDREEDLAAFCRRLNESLAQQPPPRRVVFIVEDSPNAPFKLPHVVDLNLADVWISREDFQHYARVAGVNVRDLVINGDHLPAQMDWDTVLFGDRAKVSPDQFLHNFLHAIRRED